jgi:hypothetical protein
MANPDVQELKDQASKLRAFADDVQKLADGVDGMAARMEWSGPLTDKVRGEIKTWKTRCGNVATRLREEADRFGKEAERLAGKKS